MKNKLRILAVVLAVITLTLVAFAAEGSTSEKWSKIYSASDLVAAYKEGKIVPKSLSASEAYDDTGCYFRVSADAKANASLWFTFDEAVPASKISTVVIGYRTNYATVPSGSSRFIGIDFPKDSTFNWQNRYVAEQIDRGTMNTENGYTGGKIVLKGINTKLITAGATEETIDGVRFLSNYSSLCREFQALDDYRNEALSSLSCRNLITFHDGFEYFAQYCDLNILHSLEEESGSEASAKELIHLIEEVEHHQLPAIFTEKSGSVSAASIIARETGCETYTLDMAMAGHSWFEAMYHNIDTIKEALQ